MRIVAYAASGEDQSEEKATYRDLSQKQLLLMFYEHIPCRMDLGPEGVQSRAHVASPSRPPPRTARRSVQVHEDAERQVRDTGCTEAVKHFFHNELEWLHEGKLRVK